MGPSSPSLGIVKANVVGMLWHSPQPSTQFGSTIIMGADAAPTSLSQAGPNSSSLDKPDQIQIT